MINEIIAAGYVFHPLHGNGYQFWSGIASDFQEVELPVAIVIAVVAVWHHIQCHDPDCKRPGLPVAGTSYWACKKYHHPHLQHKITAELMALTAKYGHDHPVVQAHIESQKEKDGSKGI